MAGQVSRRAALRAGLGALGVGAVGASALVGAVETRTLPGREKLNRALGFDGPPGKIPVIRGVPVTSGTFVSKFMRTTLGYSIAWPTGFQQYRVALVLHGRDGDHRTAFTELGMDRFLAQAIEDGVPPFALASIDGGAASYYHRRADGTDAGAAILEEFLPQLHKLGFDTSRVGFQGSSMGGYGAMLLATRLGPDRAAVVGAQSPAIWSQAADTAAGAYDSAADFAANDLFTKVAELQPIPTRIDVGFDDPFYPNIKRFVGDFQPPLEHGFVRGGHDADVWLRTMPDQLEFVGRHLAS